MKKNKIFAGIFLSLASLLMIGGCVKPTRPIRPTPPVVDPVMESFTKYFNTSVLATYTTNKVPDQNGVEHDYDKLFNRQITMFSENLLLRLFSTYGSGFLTDGVKGSDNVAQYQYIDATKTDGSYFSYAGKDGYKNVAYTNVNTIISTPVLNYNVMYYEYADGSLLKPNEETNKRLDDVATYSNVFFRNQGVWEDNLSDSSMAHLNFTHAINGGYVWDSETDSFSTQLNSDNAWNWNYDVNATSIINSNPTVAFNYYKAKYLPSLKTAVANIFYSGTYNGENVKTYEAIINEIKNTKSVINMLDFNYINPDTNQTRIYAIKEFVINEIIGSVAYSIDNEIAKSFPVNNKGKYLNSSIITTLDQSTHYYKAYDVLVSQLVNQALGSSFEDGTSHFLNYSNIAEITKSVNYNNLSGQKFTKIAIFPNGPITPTKLVYTVSSGSNVGLTMKYSLYSIYNPLSDSTSVALTRNKNTNTGSDVAIDLSTYKSTTLTSSSAIVFDFTNVSNTFTMLFKGYFDKNA